MKIKKDSRFRRHLASAVSVHQWLPWGEEPGPDQMCQKGQRVGPRSSYSSPLITSFHKHHWSSYYHLTFLIFSLLIASSLAQYRPNWPSPYVQREIFVLNLEDGYFGCQVNESTDFLQLFELSKLCDGVPQCFQGSDEVSLELKCTDRSKERGEKKFERRRRKTLQELNLFTRRRCTTIPNVLSFCLQTNATRRWPNAQTESVSSICAIAMMASVEKAVIYPVSKL